MLTLRGSNGPSSGSGTQERTFGARKLLGDELQLLQFGGMPKDAKPFKGVGSGVVEIALRYSSDAYRVVLALQIGRADLCFTCFSKEIEERHRNSEAGR